MGYKYAEALSRRHSVTVFAAPPGDVPAGAKLCSISAGKCNFNDVAAASLARFELGQFPRAWRLTGSNGFDIVHRVTPSAIGNSSLLPALRFPFVVGPLLASTRPPSAFDQVLRRACSPPSIGRLRPSRFGPGLARRANDWLSRRYYHLRSAKKILVGTEIAYSQVPLSLQKRCELLPYSGVEHDFYVPPIARLTNQPLQLLFVGRLVQYKGVELLLRAAAAAVRDCDIQLRVVGTQDSDYAKFCRQLVDDLKLNRVVEFLPAVSRQALLQFYQQADVFCFPTLCDTYGIALLEAMSCGCAVLTSDTSGPREIVDESFGIKVPLVEPEQYVSQFASAIVKLAREPALRDEMGRNARRRVKMHHDWTAIGSRLLEIYESL